MPNGITRTKAFCRRLPAAGRPRYGVSRETKERDDRTVLVEPIKLEQSTPQAAAVTRNARFMTTVYKGLQNDAG